MRIRLRQKRELLGLSQQQVAAQIGMTRANYGHIETGRNEPNMEQMEAIASALKVKPELNFFKNCCDKTEQEASVLEDQNSGTKKAAAS